MVNYAISKLCQQNNDDTVDVWAPRDTKFQSVLKIQGPADNPHYCDSKRLTFFADGNYDTFTFNRVINSETKIADDHFDFVLADVF